MKWLLLVIRCEPPLNLNEFDYIPLGTALLQTLFSPRVTVSMVIRSTLHLASSFSLIPISRFRRAAKFTHSMRVIRCTFTLLPSTTSTASSIHRPENLRILHDTSEVWSLMYIERCSMVESLGIQTTRRARMGSSESFTRHSLWPF